MKTSSLKLATVLVFTGWLASSWTALGQAALTINGVTDKSTYNNSVTLSVPSTAGYTYAVKLDGQPVPTDLSITVTNMDYHELTVSRTNTATFATTNRLVRFIVLSTQRGAPEKGLMAWVPYPPIPSTTAEFAGAQLQLTTPHTYPQGLPIPVIARVEDGPDRVRRGNGWVQAPGFEAAPLQIMRGHGSVMLPAVTQPGALEYAANLAGLQTTNQITVEEATAWTTAGGNIAGAVEWPENSRIHLTSSLNIPAGASLTIGAGTIVKINPLVNITNSGGVTINGTMAQPVVFTATNIVWPEVRAGAWGGFIMRGSTAQLTANHAIMTGGGGAASFSFSPPGASHRSEQAVLLIHSGARAYLTNCAIINTAGQVGNGYNCEFIADRCHFQRAITCGEYAGSSSYIKINQSAVYEFPNDNGVLSSAIVDADYDGIYFTEGTHILQNSLFGFAKDDAIDSGSGDAGTMWVSNCWVESAQHEAHAWSGGGRQTWTYDTVLINSGQGIECGWSTGNNSPLCFAERLLTLGNSVGARVGDNYDWSYNGYLRLTNTLILNNYRDVFLKTWNPAGSGLNAQSWEDRVGQVNFQSNYVTTVDSRFPGNAPWNPAAEGWRLAHYMTTPADAAVGIGLAVRTNRFAMTNLFNGTPVRLSSFTTNFVTAFYAFVKDGVDLGDGLVVFAPGETVKHIYPAGFDLTALTEVELILRGATGGELTGVTNALFTGTVGRPQVALGVATNTYSAWRLTEGVFIQLSSRSAQPVGLSYQFTSSNAVVQAGTVVVPPMAMSRQLFLTNATPFDFDRLELAVSDPVNATLTGITNVIYTYTVVPLRVSLVSAGPNNLSTFNQGVPVILNAPATAGVSVDFRVEGNRAGVTNGTLTFPLGVTSATLFTPTINPAENDFITVTLSNPVKVTLTGPSQTVYVYTPVVATPTNTLFIARGSNTIWSYYGQTTAPPASWRSNSFDHSSWLSGGAQLGYSNNEERDETTLLTNVNAFTTYFRRPFTIADASVFTHLSLWMLRDDGGIVYLNGREIFRSANVPSGTVTHTTPTVAPNGENTIDTATLLATNLVSGTNLLAVEIHQQSATSSDLSFDFELWGIPAPLPPAPLPLYYGQMQSGLNLAWSDPAFRLLESTNILGPWHTNAASGLYATPLTNREAYYQLVKP